MAEIYAQDEDAKWCLGKKLSHLAARPELEQKTLDDYNEAVRKVIAAEVVRAREDGAKGTTPRWLAAIWAMVGGVAGLGLGYLMGSL